MRSVIGMGLLLATLAAVGADIRIESDGSVAVFSARNGALVSLVAADGDERVKPAAELFTLCFLDAQGNETTMKSSEFDFRREEDRFAYSRAGGPSVTVTVRGEKGTFLFRPTVKDWPKGLRLNWIDAPQVNVSTAGRLYWPYLDGCEVFDYTTRTNRLAWNQFRHAGWVKRCTSSSAFYPGVAQMQFLAHYRDGKGLYFGAHDEHHTQKLVEWEYLDSDTARLTLETLCGDARDGVYESAFEYRLSAYAGDWMEACGTYRDWVRTLPAFRTPAALPDWAEASPVTLIYPVKGEGMDNTVEMSSNRYYPYTNALAEVERYSRLFDSKIMALLMHWEGTAPWSPPYVWPPYGGEAELARFRDALHARGDLLGLYCSGTAWTQVSCVDPRYTQSQKFTDENLGRYMMRGPKGEIDASVCNHTCAQRFGYDLCLTEPWSRKTLVDEVLKIARFGADYCQFFDQNLGGGGHRCWSAKHAHPPVPGAWAVEAMLSLQDEMIARTRQLGSKMTIGCEGAAATPFVKNLFFNDARCFFPRRYGRSVPGIPFVFHEWMCNFSGNQVAVRFDEHFRWAYSFHCGDMLSAVLGPDGKLVTAWAVPWSEELPDQERLIGLIRSLNAIRRRFPQFLLRGRMIRPFVKVSSGLVKIEGDPSNGEYPEVLTSFWQDASGNRKGFATNWRKQPSTLSLTFADGRTETRVVAPLQTIEL